MSSRARCCVFRAHLGHLRRCSAVVVDGKQRDVYKDPVTDKGKISKKGRLALVKDGDSYTTITELTAPHDDDLLVEVFREGVLLKDYTFSEVRERAVSQLDTSPFALIVCTQALPPIETLPLVAPSASTSSSSEQSCDICFILLLSACLSRHENSCLIRFRSRVPLPPTARKNADQVRCCLVHPTLSRR